MPDNRPYRDRFVDGFKKGYDAEDQRIAQEDQGSSTLRQVGEGFAEGFGRALISPINGAKFLFRIFR